MEERKVVRKKKTAGKNAGINFGFFFKNSFHHVTWRKVSA